MIMFRGREQSRPEMGYRLLQRMAADVAELGYVESKPKQDGRNMIMVIGPHKKKAEAKAEQRSAARTTTPPAVEQARGAMPCVDASAEADRAGLTEPDARRHPGAVAPPGDRPVADRTSARATGADDEESTAAMPKMKTHSGAKKRFRITGTGKVMREQANRRHLLEGKSSTRDPPPRRTTSQVSPADAKKAQAPARQVELTTALTSSQHRGDITWHA